MVGYRKIEGFEGMESSFVKTRLKWIALLCPILSLTYAQTTPNYAKNSLSGTSIGFNLAYNYSDVKHHFYRCDWRSKSRYQEGIYEELWRGQDCDVPIKQKRCSIDPAISIGYSFLKNNWYFGVIGEISFGKSRKRLIPFSYYFDAIFTISGFCGGIKAMCGYYFNDINTLIYGITGMKWRKVETQINYKDEGKSRYDAVDYRSREIYFFGPKEKLTCPLFVIGTGIERLFCEKLSIFAEYEYTWMNPTATAVTTRFGVYEFKKKERLKEHSFRLGVKYHI